MKTEKERTSNLNKKAEYTFSQKKLLNFASSNKMNSLYLLVIIQAITIIFFGILTARLSIIINGQHDYFIIGKIFIFTMIVLVVFKAIALINIYLGSKNMDIKKLKFGLKIIYNISKIIKFISLIGFIGGFVWLMFEFALDNMIWSFIVTLALIYLFYLIKFVDYGIEFIDWTIYNIEGKVNNLISADKFKPFIIINMIYMLAILIVNLLNHNNIDLSFLSANYWMLSIHMKSIIDLLDFEYLILFITSAFFYYLVDYYNTQVRLKNFSNNSNKISMGFDFKN